MAIIISKRKREREREREREIFKYLQNKKTIKKIVKSKSPK